MEFYGWMNNDESTDFAIFSYSGNHVGIKDFNGYEHYCEAWNLLKDKK